MGTGINRRTRSAASASLVQDLIEKGRKQLKNVIPPLVAIAVLLIIWQLFSSLPGASLPSPLAIISDPDSQQVIFNPFFDKGGTNKGLFWQALSSLQRVLIGYSAAAVVGIAVGIAIGTTPVIYRALDPIFQILRTIPPLAWLPISLATFQQNNPSALFVIFITAIWPIIINTSVGIQQIPQDYTNVARVLRLSKQKYFLRILLPATVPYIFTGMRIAIGLAWLAIVAAEMLIGGVGIGFFIWDSWNSGRVGDIIVALVWIGVIGWVLDKLIALIASRLTPGEQRPG